MRLVGVGDCLRCRSRVDVSCSAALRCHVVQRRCGAAPNYLRGRACDAAASGVNNSWLGCRNARLPQSLRRVSELPSDIARSIWSRRPKDLPCTDVLNGPDAPADGRYREWRIRGPRRRLRSAGFAIEPRHRKPFDARSAGLHAVWTRGRQSICRARPAFGRRRVLTAASRHARPGRSTPSSLRGGSVARTPSFCDGGATLHEVWVDILAATVTINDVVAPTVSDPTGELTDASVWQSGLAGRDVLRRRQHRDPAAEGLRRRDRGAHADGARCGGRRMRLQESGRRVHVSRAVPGRRGLNTAQTIEVDTAASFGNGTRSLRRGVS